MSFHGITIRNCQNKMTIDKIITETVILYISKNEIKRMHYVNFSEE